MKSFHLCPLSVKENTSLSPQQYSRFTKSLLSQVHGEKCSWSGKPRTLLWQHQAHRCWPYIHSPEVPRLCLNQRRKDQYLIVKTINSVQLATPNVGSDLFIFLTRVSGIVWAKRPADQLGSKQYIGFRQAPFKLHLRRLLFNEEFYRTRKQIADGTSQFKKHSVNVRARNTCEV